MASVEGGGFPSSASKSRAVVWGAGGFVGAELLRLILGHPHLELAAALSNTHEGRPIGEIHPGLASWTSLRFEAEDGWEWEPMKQGSWTLFACLAHRQTMHRLPRVLEVLEESKAVVIDLSGDFRLPDAASYGEYYGEQHAAPQWLPRFVYGLPELNRDGIRGSRRISNPGCLSTGAQLAILPLAGSDLAVDFIALDGKTGSSGAGIQARPTTHHPLRSNNFRAYGVSRHQHFPEIAGGWATAGGSAATEISFVPQMAPMVRGIFTTAHLFLRDPAPSGEVERIYQEFYADASMVRLVADSPTVAEVWGSNRCDLAVHAQGRRVVVCTAIDNLVKGAAGQAIQNANLAHGWDESAGLKTPAPWPV